MSHFAELYQAVTLQIKKEIQLDRFSEEEEHLVLQLIDDFYGEFQKWDEKILHKTKSPFFNLTYAVIYHILYDLPRVICKQMNENNDGSSHMNASLFFRLETPILKSLQDQWDKPHSFIILNSFFGSSIFKGWLCSLRNDAWTYTELLRQGKISDKELILIVKKHYKHRYIHLTKYICKHLLQDFSMTLRKVIQEYLFLREFSLMQERSLNS